MSKLFVICLLTVTAFALIESVNSIWENYSVMFGPNLQKTFQSSFSLYGEHQHTQLVSNTSNAFKCASYLNGTAVASVVREKNHSSHLIPVLVDSFAKKRICFLSVHSQSCGIETQKKKLEPLFDFSIPLLPSLKIHDSVYSFEDMFFVDKNKTWSPEALPLDLTVMFVNQTFNCSHAAKSHFSRILEGLSSYDLKSFDRFFWTSHFGDVYFKTAPEVVRNSVEFQADLVRQAEWLAISTTFNRSVVPISAQDPCGFKTISLMDAIKPARVVISVEHLMGMVDRQLTRTCIAYLSVVFSVEVAVNHIALTHRPRLFNLRARSIQQSASVGNDGSTAPYTAAGMKGEDQIVAIADTGLDMQSCYFQDRNGAVPFSDVGSPVFDTQWRKVIQYTYTSSSDTSDEMGGHGTHVSGIVAGNIDGADVFSDGQYDGVAPEAKIAFMDLGTPGSGLAIPPVEQLYGDGWHAGARVHTNSWGSTFSGSQYYCSHDVDDLTHNNQGILVLFAAGNFGSDGDSTVTMDSSGKNVLTVGSSESTLGSSDIDYVSWFSSRGPVYDQRFKPDLVAPGEQIMSAKSNGGNGDSCDTLEMMGTSMASPAAAGAALLVRQYFMDTNNRFWTGVCNTRYNSCNSFEPSGVLVKAILIHSGSGMSKYDANGDDQDRGLGTPPDFYQGFGRVTLQNVLPLPNFLPLDLFVDDQFCLGENSAVSYKIVLQPQDTFVPVKATLVWYDPANVDGTTNNALLQDLDLTVTSPGGDTLYPNGRGDRDFLNTVERVVVDDPQEGVYTVTVSSNSLPVTGAQCFALVITSRGAVVYA